MARRGDVARQNVTNTILQAFEGSFVNDKKIYVRAKDEGGEMVQFAVTLTMPKVPVENGGVELSAGGQVDGHDWSSPVATTNPQAAISEEDKEKVSALMKSLGII